MNGKAYFHILMHDTNEETLYGVHDVCYNHGCRKKKEELIFGHKPGNEQDFHEKERKTRSYRQAVIDVARTMCLSSLGSMMRN